MWPDPKCWIRVQVPVYMPLKWKMKVVEACTGLTSRLYRDGRFSPAMETGVHHFHLLLQHHMADFLLNN